MNKLYAAGRTVRATLDTAIVGGIAAGKFLVIGATLLLAACGGSSSGGDPASDTYTVAGSISGLAAAGLVLQNNAGDNLTVAANSSSFQFATPISAGGDYNVTVATQPTGLICTVSHGMGTNISAAVTNISVVCSANTHTIAGTISGLTTNGLVLRNNGADDLSVTANATTFQFVTPVAAGGGYSVTAFTQPAGLTCTVNNGVSSNVNANVTNIHIVCSAITFTVGGTISGLTSNGLVLQNNSGDDLSIANTATTFEFAAPVAYGGGYAVTVLTQPSGQHCSIVDDSGTATTQISNVALTCSQTSLSQSVSTLGLGVSGNARTITITNTGLIDATGVSYSPSPALPAGTIISPATCGTIAPAATCVLTVTPGATPSATPGDTAPLPITLTISGNETNTLTPTINIVTYGSVYQAGFVFAIDDTTPTTGSIGGTVVSLTDQATPFSPGIIWSSNSSGTSDGGVNIYGISETSTVVSPAPSTGQVAGQSACEGKIDGVCNTANIIAYYSPPTTTPAIPLSYYAAGLCKATIDGYSDWHLPAACELDNSNVGFSCTNAQSIVNNLPSLIGSTSTDCVYGANCLVGSYGSSTQYSLSSQQNVLIELFAPGGGHPSSALKASTLGTRCARVLTL